jgi:hypothetical protein
LALLNMNHHMAVATAELGVLYAAPLEAFIDEYLAAAGSARRATPLFRSAIGKTGVLTDKPMNRVDAYRMVRRRTADAGFKVKLGCHVFRATDITAYSRPAAPSKTREAMAAHEARARPSSTTAPATKSRSTRSSGSRFSRSGRFGSGWVVEPTSEGRAFRQIGSEWI